MAGCYPELQSSFSSAFRRGKQVPAAIDSGAHFIEEKFLNFRRQREPYRSVAIPTNAESLRQATCRLQLVLKAVAGYISM